MPSDSPLARLPAELVLSIFCALPSFSDVAWFATTCHRHRQIWVNYVYTIYHNVSPRTIPHCKYAWMLLSDQGGPPASATHLAFHEVLQLVRNAGVTEQSIADSQRTRKRRRPYLSCTQRVRFIRGLYQLWSLLLLDRKTRHRRIEHMKLEDRMVVRSFLGRDAVYIPDPAVFALEGRGTAVALVNVYVDIAPYLGQLVSGIFGQRLGSWPYSYSGGLRGCITVWNLHYGLVKNLMLKRGRRVPCSVCQVVWYGTFDVDEREWRQEADFRKGYGSVCPLYREASPSAPSSSDYYSDSSSEYSSSTSSSRAPSRSSDRSDPFSDRFYFENPFSDTEIVGDPSAAWQALSI